jgi:hypothetical protein
MSATFRQLPATLNLIVKSGDSVSKEIDLGVNVSGQTVSSRLHSFVDGRKIYDIPTQISNQTAGKVSMSFLSGHTSGIPAGTYRWDQRILGQSDQTQTVLSGVVEFVR